MKAGGEMCLESFGQYLRKERESRHISLEEFSRRIRMGSCFITALEENNHAFFSKPEFFSCILKRYARQLGIDSEEAVRRFADQYELDPQKKPYVKNYSNTFRSWEKRKRFRGVLIFVAIFLLILFFIGFLSLNKPPKPRSFAMLSSMAEELGKPFFISMILPLSSITEEKGLSAGARESFERVSLQEQYRKNPANEVKDYSEGVLPSGLGRMKVVGNRDSKRYHLPGMKYYNKVEAYHRMEFASEEEAIQAGYHKAPR
jgi:transcriptional regulator with XRE-family HTH domain